MQSANALRLSFLIGLTAAAALLSSCVAFEFGWPRQLGSPLIGWFYPPWSVIGWWNAWGYAEPYRSFFREALIDTVFVFIAPIAVARLLQMHGRLNVDDRPRDSGLGTPRDLRRIGNVRSRGPGVVIGKDGWNILRSVTDTHVGVFGFSRSGKGATVGIPTALLHPGSAFIFDPKDAVLGIVGRRRAEFGPVHNFNPTDRTRARFNPLLELRTDHNLIGDCQQAACLLTDAGKGAAKDPFWDRSAGYLLSGLLYHVRMSRDPSLGHLWRLVQDIDNNRYPKNVPDFSARILDGFKRREQKLRDSMVATVISHLQFLADPVVQYVTAESSFRAGDLSACDTPVTVGLAVPPSQRERLTPLTRLVLQSTVRPLMHDRHFTTDDRRKQRGALLMIDEFPSLRYMELMEDVLKEGAEYGLRLLAICQGVEDIQKFYGRDQTLTNNFGTMALMPGFSPATLDMAVKLAGKRAIAQASKQHAFSFKGNHSMSESETLRNVLDPRDMLLRARDEVLVFTTGCKPTYLQKIRYWQDRAFKGLFDTPEPAETPFTIPNPEEVSPWLITHRC